MQRLLKEQLQEQTETVKTRPPSSALLGIDSANRFRTLAEQTIARNTDANANPYDFNLYAPTNFIQGYFTRIAVSEVTFPFAIPNINDFTQNIAFNYSPNPTGPYVRYEIQIEAGWYDFDGIAKALQDELNALAIDAFTVEYDQPPAASAVDYGYVCTSADADSRFYFEPMYLPGFENQKGLYQMMNWQFANAIRAGGAGFATNEAYSGQPTLLFTNYVDFVCNNLTAVQDVRDGSSSNRPRDAICRLYLTDSLNSDPTLGSKPFNVFRQFTNPKLIKWENNLPVASLSFQVYNDCGYILGGVDPVRFSEVGDPQDMFPTEIPDWQMSLLLSEQ